MHAELSGGTHPYSAGGTHRHLGEFDQEFTKAAGRPVHIQFTPHLMPFNRGFWAPCMYGAAHQRCTGHWPTVTPKNPSCMCLPFGQLPSTRSIAGSNFVHLGVVGDRIAGRAIVVVALDNLTKGSSGQAIQNANLMLGLEETAGLMAAPVFP